MGENQSDRALVPKTLTPAALEIEYPYIALVHDRDFTSKATHSQEDERIYLPLYTVETESKLNMNLFIAHNFPPCGGWRARRDSSLSFSFPFYPDLGCSLSFSFWAFHLIVQS